MSDKKKTTQLTKEDILHLANLVRLELSENEIKDLQAQLCDTINYIKNLSELDTDSVKEIIHNTQAKNVSLLT